ncbi:MAG: copper resistance protein CopC [Cellulomonas iranensis]|uniref:copper resistance CopC family protein n=1 Tax=Cellulomonas iranensis TaxID=76862 RepID=UPI001B15B017|nr:copper resistance CopC family protein [Cellulomonas iranensis]MBO9569629.1 copper resistance protein CopC [Cellulomonas iranensis]
MMDPDAAPADVRATPTDPGKVMRPHTPSTVRLVPAAPLRRARVALALVVTGLLALTTAGPAAAHNALRSSDPADGSTVATAPDAITLTFDQAALELGTEIVVTAADGTIVSEGPAQLVDTSVVQPLAAERPAGAYSVMWRVTSADGHPIIGAFSFTATDAAGAPAAPAEPTPDAQPTPDATDEASPEPTMTTQDTAEPTVEATPISAPVDDDGGVPAWVWVLLAVVVVGGGAVVAFVARGRTQRDGTTGTGPGAGA